VHAGAGHPRHSTHRELGERAQGLAQVAGVERGQKVVQLGENLGEFGARHDRGCPRLWIRAQLHLARELREAGAQLEAGYGPLGQQLQQRRLVGRTLDVEAEGLGEVRSTLAREHERRLHRPAQLLKLREAARQLVRRDLFHLKTHRLLASVEQLLHEH
jgi:hypothetical protein